MRFEAGVVREQGVTFAVVLVKKSMIDSPSGRVRTQQAFAEIFEGVPVVLMARDDEGRASFWGRSDLSRFLANTPLDAIPWCEYETMNYPC